MYIILGRKKYVKRNVAKEACSDIAIIDFHKTDPLLLKHLEPVMTAAPCCRVSTPTLK